MNESTSPQEWDNELDNAEPSMEWSYATDAIDDEPFVDEESVAPDETGLIDEEDEIGLEISAMDHIQEDHDSSVSPSSIYREQMGQVAASDAFDVASDQIIGITPFKWVQNTRSSPFKMICCLVMKGKNGQTGILGTGWLAHPRVIVTAGHNVFDTRFGGWHQHVDVFLARNGPSGTSIGHQRVPRSSLRTNRRYMQTGSNQFDYGGLILPRSISPNFFGIREESSPVGRKVSAFGYPINRSKRMHGTANGVIWKASSRTLSYRFDTTTGQSGMPVFRSIAVERNGRRFADYQVIGIHNAAVSRANAAARINREVHNIIKKWIREVS